MNMLKAPLVCTVLAGALLAGHAAPARAGDVSNATAECYVDTYAYDVPTAGDCYSVWTPGTANNPSVAVFTVAGLPAGSYSYQWKNLETGATVCGNQAYCLLSIATETRGDGYAAASVTVTDTQTGAQKTSSAEAYYFDGYN